MVVLLNPKINLPLNYYSFGLLLLHVSDQRYVKLPVSCTEYRISKNALILICKKIIGDSSLEF